MTSAVIGAAAAVVAAMLLIVILLRRGRNLPIDTAEEAAAAAEQALAGFVAADAVVGADGRGALAIGADGRVAAIGRRGRRIAVREISWAAVRATGYGVIVETGERRLGDVLVTGVNALDMRRLAAAGRMPA